ncbi:MAG: hypothetical protein RL038_446 [Actinomycetota bacterium]|jgi:histidine triad (HIT) family protein
MNDCLFCKIVAGDIPAKLVAENDNFLAFADIAPTAPVHVVAVPKTHYANAAEFADADSQGMGQFMQFITEIGESETSNGYRLVFNTDADGGQTVFHVHAHVLGGRAMQWPAG